MGYIITLVVILVVVPLLFILLSRRTARGGSAVSRNHGVTVEEPSSDQPTPRSDGTVNPDTSGIARRLPPG